MLLLVTCFLIWVATCGPNCTFVVVSVRDVVQDGLVGRLDRHRYSCEQEVLTLVPPPLFLCLQRLGGGGRLETRQSMSLEGIAL